MRVLLTTAFAMTTALDTRWDAATALLASTVPARRTRDHRAKHAVVIGAVDDLITAVQPDRGGRKLVFLASDGALVGELGLMTGADDESLLRGARVDVTARGRGRAATMLGFWLHLCRLGDVAPTTSRINKPLLALALTSAGFVPLEADDACVCDVASSDDGGVSVALSTAPTAFRRRSSSRSASPSSPN